MDTNKKQTGGRHHQNKTATLVALSGIWVVSRKASSRVCEEGLMMNGSMTDHEASAAEESLAPMTILSFVIVSKCSRTTKITLSQL